jgi:protein-disulfide isomerase
MPSYFPVEEHKLTKKEKKELRRLEWQEKAKAEARNTKVKKFSLWGVITLAILIVVFVLFQAVTSSSNQTQTIKIAPISARDISTGNPKSKVTLIEYADFQCPACAAYHSVVDQLLSSYGNKIFYVYRMFPLTNAHPNALISAQAAYAAYKQGEFVEYGNLLFQNQNDWATLKDPKPTFIGYAKSLKLDTNKFQTDMTSEQTQKYVQDSESEALSEGINQTPTFFINGNVIQNPNNYDDFKKLIDATLNKK